MGSNHRESSLPQKLISSSFFRWYAFSLGSFAGVYFLTIFFAEVVGLSKNWAFFPPLVILFFWNFITMRYFVYGKPVISAKEQFIKYATSAVAFRCIEMLAYWALVSRMGVYYTHAVLIVMPLGFIAKFLFYKTHIFISKPLDQPHSAVLAPSDLDTLAELHTQSLPDSMVTRMGFAYTKSFYRYVHHSRDEFLLVKRIDNTICTACVVSLSPKNLSRRLLFETPLALTLLTRLPVILKRLTGGSRGPSSPVSPQLLEEIDGMPELLLIYSSPSARGKGYGAQIMNEAEEEIEKRGYTAYSLKTIDDESNQATRFYTRQGLQTRYSTHKQGRKFSVWSKELCRGGRQSSDSTTTPTARSQPPGTSAHSSET